jgi:hypothetical protein
VDLVLFAGAFLPPLVFFAAVFAFGRVRLATFRVFVFFFRTIFLVLRRAILMPFRVCRGGKTHRFKFLNRPG